MGDHKERAGRSEHRMLSQPPPWSVARRVDEHRSRLLRMCSRESLGGCRLAAWQRAAEMSHERRGLDGAPPRRLGWAISRQTQQLVEEASLLEGQRGELSAHLGATLFPRNTASRSVAAVAAAVAQFLAVAATPCLIVIDLVAITAAIRSSEYEQQ